MINVFVTICVNPDLVLDSYGTVKEMKNEDVKNYSHPSFINFCKDCILPNIKMIDIRASIFYDIYSRYSFLNGLSPDNQTVFGRNVSSVFNFEKYKSMGNIWYKNVGFNPGVAKYIERKDLDGIKILINDLGIQRMFDKQD